MSKEMNTDNAKIALDVLGFSFNQNRTGAYGLVLAEKEGIRRLMIVIGAPEAQSIAFSLQSSMPPRPLTHDLFNNLLCSFGIELKEVSIHKYENGIFYAQMMLKQDSKDLVLDARTSDAVGIALRHKTPIFTTEKIMRELSVVIDDSPKSSTPFAGDLSEYPLDYALLSPEELKDSLKNAVGVEDYELASILRDEIKRRKTKKDNPEERQED